MMEFNKSIVHYPSIKRYPGGASNDWSRICSARKTRSLLLDMKNLPNIKGSGG